MLSNFKKVLKNAPSHFQYVVRAKNANTKKVVIDRWSGIDNLSTCKFWYIVRYFAPNNAVWSLTYS